MSGHSKFANIKHKKEKNDAAKGKVFTIIGREIAVAVKKADQIQIITSKLAQVIAKGKGKQHALMIQSKEVLRRLLVMAMR